MKIHLDSLRDGRTQDELCDWQLHGRVLVAPFALLTAVSPLVCLKLLVTVLPSARAVTLLADWEAPC